MDVEKLRSWLKDLEAFMESTAKFHNGYVKDSYNFKVLFALIGKAVDAAGVKAGDRVVLNEDYPVPMLHPDGTHHGWYCYRHTFKGGATAVVREVGADSDGALYMTVVFDRLAIEFSGPPVRVEWREGENDGFGFPAEWFDKAPAQQAPQASAETGC